MNNQSQSKLLKLIHLKMNNRAQISAEMLMILAALVGLSVFVLKNLGETAKGTADKIGNKSAEFNKTLDEVFKIK